MSAKERLDLLVLGRGLTESRSKAQALIRAGEVFVDGQRMDKPGMSVPEDARIELKARLPFVGRGGLKLQAALDGFAIRPEGWACLDVGASTGGFTDCLLQRGARIVYAVDVGTAQLDWKLRSDPRVVVMEQTDIRGLESLPEPIELTVVDVAFISLLRVLPAIGPLLAEEAALIALVKPQFEVGREQVGRGGIVREPRLREAALRSVMGWAEAEGWQIAGLVDSPIAGQRGNREFLLRLNWPGSAASTNFDSEAALERLEGLRSN